MVSKVKQIDADIDCVLTKLKRECSVSVPDENSAVRIRGIIRKTFVNEIVERGPVNDIDSFIRTNARSIIAKYNAKN